MIKGVIFDIKKFAVHDGPGIRSTVFLKGCPLNCRWCHNPEGIAAKPEIMVFASRCLDRCRACVTACAHGCLSKRRGNVRVDRGRCLGCGRCVEACPAEALQLAGRLASPETIIAELEKDSLFYRTSGGGITVSGGEPMQQPRFLRSILIGAKRQGWHTALDTCGLASWAAFSRITPWVDLFLFDLKCIDEARHRRLTGGSNGPILDNLRRLSKTACSLAIRVPLVPGCNDTQAEMSRMAEFCASLPRSHAVQILPYHRGGSGKRERLDLTEPLPGIRPPTAAKIKRIMEIFSRRQLAVTLGG